MFGISTHLFHGERLERRHLEQISAAGFDLVEVFATRTHFDYHAPEAIAQLGEWLSALGMRAASLHAPICDGFVGGVWGRAYSNASPQAAVRDEAVNETTAAIVAAQALGCDALVLHIGLPRGQAIPPGDNSLTAARRSLEPIAGACTRAGVQLALEVIPNDLASPGALLDLLAGDLELGGAAVCLDVGHAHLMGGAPEAAEALAGFVVTTHIHDNRGTSDDHLVPFAGTIDWPLTLTALTKIGYHGPLVFELPDHGHAGDTLGRAIGARARLQAILDGLAEPLPFEES
jgi:sugar phosphate isomerase/epimerase